MHGVDTDQYLAYHAFIRKTVKRPKKAYFHISIFCIQKAATHDITCWNITEDMF
jgi:hypothetical protein